MGRRIQKEKKPKSLHFILWLSFFVFAVLVIAVYGVSETALLQQTYRRLTVQNLDAAAKEAVYGLEHLPGEAGFGLHLRGISETYGVTVRVVSEDGVLLYPLVADEEEKNDFLQEVEKMRENDGKIYPASRDGYAFAAHISVNGQEGYLYITDHVVMDGGVFLGMLLQTGYIALIIMLAAFLLSGAISMYVSHPIAELNKKAQSMNYGNLNVDFSRKKGDIGYREIEELSETLNRAEGELSKSEKMQKEVIANVSHDFKTPLTMIKAYASMIQEISGDNPEKRKKHTQIIIDEADRLASLVNDLLSLSKISAGLEGIKPTLFNLSDYLCEIVGRFGYLVETQGYTFETDIADALFVEADKEKIGQVLYNLIGNAVNYTGEDKKVTVRLYGENGVGHFSVTDTGAGIPPDQMQTIWERYYRSGETHKRPVSGTGLGLSIVKTILDKHGFRYGVHSEVGKGSTFYVDFPVKAVAEFKEGEE